MFGYVVIDKPNITFKDFATYRAYYCGLCKTIGKIGCQSLRFLINYDITFLSLLAHNYNKTVPTFSQEHCIVHPIGKKITVVDNNDIQEKIADVNTLLAYYKVVDDKLDDGGFKYDVAHSWLKKKFEKAKTRLPILSAVIDENYTNLRKLESEKCNNITKLSHCFAIIMAEVGKSVCKDADENLSLLCYNLGKWIYFIDAIDDLEKDFKEKKFNPFNPESKALTKDEKNIIIELAKSEIVKAIEEITLAYDKMEITISEPPLSNIVYLGLKERSRQVLLTEI